MVSLDFSYDLLDKIEIIGNDILLDYKIGFDFIMAFGPKVNSSP